MSNEEVPLIFMSFCYQPLFALTVWQSTHKCAYTHTQTHTYRDIHMGNRHKPSCMCKAVVVWGCLSLWPPLMLLQPAPLVPCTPALPPIYLSLYTVLHRNLIKWWIYVEPCAAGLSATPHPIPGTPLMVPEFPEAKRWGSTYCQQLTQRSLYNHEDDFWVPYNNALHVCPSAFNHFFLGFA